MSANQTLEARLAVVEKDVAELKTAVFVQRSQRPWYEKMVGSMKDFPEFEQVAQLGREFRKADSPQHGDA